MYEKERARRIIDRQENFRVLIFEAVSWGQILVPVLLIAGNMWLLVDVCRSFDAHYPDVDFYNFLIPGLFSSLGNMYIPYLLKSLQLNDKNGEGARSDGPYIVTYVLYSLLGVQGGRFTRSERSMILSILLASAVIQVYLLFEAVQYANSGTVSNGLIRNLAVRVFASICLDIMAGNFSVSMLVYFKVIAGDTDTPGVQRPVGTGAEGDGDDGGDGDGGNGEGEGDGGTGDIELSGEGSGRGDEDGKKMTGPPVGTDRALIGGPVGEGRPGRALPSARSV